MTHPFDTLIIISSHLIWLASPGEFRVEALIRNSPRVERSLTPAHPEIKMSICLHINLLQKEVGFFFPTMLTFCFPMKAPWEEKAAGSCCPLLDIKRYTQPRVICLIFYLKIKQITMCSRQRCEYQLVLTQTFLKGRQSEVKCN